MKSLRKEPYPTVGSLSCIIYCRVSSGNQANGNSVSLEVQESVAKKLAKSKGYRIKRVCKEVISAYSTYMKSLKELLMGSKNTYIMLYDVSRFSRNVENGIAMLDIALKRNNKLVFVQDGLIIDLKNRGAKIGEFMMLLKQSENESRNIGERVRSSKQYLREQGRHIGGFVTYGYSVQNGGLLVMNQTEQNVIAFVNKCRKNLISGDELNALMQKISPQIPYAAIKCYDKDGETILKTIYNALTYGEIAGLLNDYGVKKRGKKWTAFSVKSSIKKCGELDNLSLGYKNSEGGGGELLNSQVGQFSQFPQYPQYSQYPQVYLSPYGYFLPYYRMCCQLSTGMDDVD